VIGSATAVILAGGLGTRLRAVVADRPKALAPIAGRPFLSYLLDQLRAAGIRRVVLCIGHLGEQIRAVFGSSYRGIDLVYSQEPSPIGTGGALRHALPLLGESPLLVMNGDSYCAVDLGELWSWHHLRSAPASLVAVDVADASRFGRIEVDRADRVIGFHEKSTDAIAGRVNGGVYLVAPELIARIPAGGPVSLEREVFPGWIEEGLYAFSANARFIDIGTPESFALAERFVRDLASEAA
jgi:D-glycero-alpha-D-manno-heptose 1-phosphate guanylyltransferase